MEDNSNLDDHSRTIIHIDLDCYYAQVEMIKNPSLRNLPLGIQQKNYVITSNYVARELGVKKCMLVTEAQKLCPNLVLVNGEDLHDYKQISYKVTSHLHKYSSCVERLGLDENFIDITNLINDKMKSECEITCIGNVFGNSDIECDCGCSERLKLGTMIAQEIRDSIRSELNLTSCAGIAHNKLLAKLVGSKFKPNQQTLLLPNSAVELMLSLPSVISIPGVGYTTGQKLNSIHIETVSDLQTVDYQKLKVVVGEEKAKLLCDLSFGVDKSAVKPTGKPQTIGIEDSCKSLSIQKEVKEKLLQLLHRLMVLVEEDGRMPKTIKLTVRKYDKNSKFGNRETRQCNINTSLFDAKNVSRLSAVNENKLMAIIMRLFSKLVDTKQPFHLTLLGLSFTKFSEPINIKNTLKSFLKKDLEVQSITNLENVGESSSSPKIFPSTSSFNNEYEEDVEPNAKKHKLNTLIAKRRCQIEPDDCESPSKLRVADLRLNSTDSTDSNQNICCPPNADEEVFKELPKDMQRELWNEYKQIRDKEENTLKLIKKSKTNSIRNYFLKQ